METVEERLKSLMMQSLAGDARAYRLLLGDCGARLRAYYLRRLDDASATDDLVQETLIAIHARRATYDPARPFTAWLHAIARYKLVDYLRARRRRAAAPLDEAPQALLAVEETPAATTQDLDRLLEQIPPLPRSLIRAVKLEGRSIAEASQASGLSPSAVKVAIHRALKRLSRRIEEEDDQ